MSEQDCDANRDRYQELYEMLVGDPVGTVPELSAEEHEDLFLMFKIVS